MSEENVHLRNIVDTLKKDGFDFNARFNPEHLKKYQMGEKVEYNLEMMRRGMDNVGDVMFDVFLGMFDDVVHDTYENRSKATYEVMLFPRERFKIRNEKGGPVQYNVDFLSELTLCTSQYDPKVLIDKMYRPLGFELVDGTPIDKTVFDTLKKMDKSKDLSYDGASQYKQGIDLALRPGGFVLFDNEFLKDHYVVNSTDTSNFGKSHLQKTKYKKDENAKKKYLNKGLMMNFSIKATQLVNMGRTPKRLTTMPYEGIEGKII